MVEIQHVFQQSRTSNSNSNKSLNKIKAGVNRNLKKLMRLLQVSPIKQLSPISTGINLFVSFLGKTATRNLAALSRSRTGWWLFPTRYFRNYESSGRQRVGVQAGLQKGTMENYKFSLVESANHCCSNSSRYTLCSQLSTLYSVAFLGLVLQLCECAGASREEMR